jgi:tripartite-type tricarboxylate transporter receptor subunit TctC
VFGASGLGSYANQHAMVLKHMVGAKLRVITGFTGIKDIGLALERGEVQAACALALSTAKAAFDGNVKRGELKFLVQFGKQDVPYFGGAPNFYKLLKSDDQRQIADLFFGQSEIARPLIGPPGLPPAVVTALRKAMADAVADKDFRAEAAKSGLDIEFVSGEETAQSFADFYKTPADVLKKAREIMGRG